MKSSICLFTENDFEKTINTGCVYDVETSFEKFEEAEDECKTSKQCKGVLDVDCNTQGKYYLCSERHESNNTIESCVYRKLIVGEDIAFILSKT